MDPFSLGLLGYGIYQGAKSLFSEESPSSGSSSFPDLFQTLNYRRGVPYGRCDSFVLSGVLGGFEGDLSECVVQIHLLDQDGDFLKSRDELNRDSDGDFVAVSDLVPAQDGAKFEALVSAGAFQTVSRYKPLIVMVTGAGPTGVFSRSRFVFENGKDFLGEGNAPYIQAIAYHILLIARAERTLQKSDLRNMIEKISNFFSLNSEGQKQFRDILKEHSRMHQSVSEMGEVHGAIFNASRDLDRRITNMLFAIIHDEVVDRSDFHTQTHAHILRCMAQFCPDTDLQLSLRRLGAAIEQDIGASGEQQAQIDEERARHCEILGVPIDASPEQIKRAYREAMKEVHPDLIRNLPPRQRKVLEKHAREINEAKEVLLSQ
ncbi:DnaJ family molecular chaperone [Puniceibacterium sp. IMCC21224]|uniref:J domain-containing protein n=1 Tax=Puniceibacterium sp. IMCC21224 TaxID=1618204 RepID=UPI00065D944B|nr:J domain-containing protein [Puniceibacterium sp. IMCC21224]KMK66002.1 DnaJ-like protein [Puniceibacterium sp. IMCC21224]